VIREAASPCWFLWWTAGKPGNQVGAHYTSSPSFPAGQASGLRHVPCDGLVTVDEDRAPSERQLWCQRCGEWVLKAACRDTTFRLLQRHCHTVSCDCGGDCALGCECEGPDGRFLLAGDDPDENDPYHAITWTIAHYTAAEAGWTVTADGHAYSDACLPPHPVIATMPAPADRDTTEELAMRQLEKAASALAGS
jgi:hypothetical protein